MKYAKTALSIPDQIARLQGIGLTIGNTADAQHALQFIGHFRLKGYFLPFMRTAGSVRGVAGRTFVPNTTMAQVLDLYRFDQKLRLLMLAQIEKLEVAIRTVICHELSIQFGPHWYVTHADQVFDLAKFKLYEFLQQWDKDARREKNPFTTHYYAKYTDPPIPPSWAVAECVTMGKWSFLYRDLKVSRNAIATPFGLPADVFESWLHSLTVLRNACAHHARVWNRRFAIQPRVHRGYPLHFAKPSSFYTLAVIVRLLTRSYDPGSTFHQELKSLVSAHLSVSQPAMGFIPGWANDPLWN